MKNSNDNVYFNQFFNRKLKEIHRNSCAICKTFKCLPFFFSELTIFCMYILFPSFNLKYHNFIIFIRFVNEIFKLT